MRLYFTAFQHSTVFYYASIMLLKYCMHIVTKNNKKNNQCMCSISVLMSNGLELA